MEKLYVIDGPIKGKSFTLTDGITTIGRSSDNDICISDTGVSRHHAELLKRDDKIFIVDARSLQGVFIDGEKIEPGLEVEITKESRVTIGKTILSFQKESTGEEIAEPYPTNGERKPFDTSESRDAIYITTREGKFVDINQSFLDLFGYTRGEMADLRAQEAYANPDDRSRFQEIEQKGSVRDLELNLRKKDGTEMGCLLTATVWRAADGSILGYHGIIRKITGHQQAAEEEKKL